MTRAHEQLAVACIKVVVQSVGTANITKRQVIQRHCYSVLPTSVLLFFLPTSFLFFLLASAASFLHDDRLLASQNGARTSHCTHLQVRSVLSVQHSSPDGLQSCSSVALQLNTGKVLGWFAPSSVVACDKYHPFARRRRFNTDTLSAHQTVVAE